MGAGWWRMIASRGWLAGLLLIQPRMLVALSAARAHCWLLFGLFSDTSPVSLSAEWPVLPPGIFASQVQDSTFVPVELHEVPIDPFLQPA